MSKPFFFPLILCLIMQNYSPGQNNEIDSLKKVLDLIKEKEAKASVYNQLSKLYYYKDPQQTIDMGNLALSIAMEYEDQEEQFYALLNIGVGYSMLGNNQKPIEYHLQASTIAEELNDLQMMASIYNELGIDYRYAGNFEKSIEYFLKSLTVKETLPPGADPQKNKSSIANALNNVGVIYDEMGYYDKALEYYNKCLKIREEIDDKKGLASVLHNIGVVYEEKGDFLRSLEYYKQSLAIKETFGVTSSYATTIGNIGIIYLDLGDFEKALEYHEKALEIFRDLEDLRSELNMMNSIADIYLEMNRPGKAYSYISKVIKMATEIDDKVILRDAYKFLAAYYAATSNFEKAYDVQQDLLQLKDSLYTQEMAENIAEMQAKYETEKKEQEIQLLTKDNEIQSLKIKKQSTQLYLLILFVVFAVLLSMLIFNRYQFKQKQYQSDLVKKNLETEQRMLRSQMNPHFIFNSMNSIQSYISGNDNFTAMTYLSKFAQLMRGILENSRKKMISLEEEINTLNLYVELEQLRFKNKFEFKLEFDPQLFPETTFIPPMLVQPFVENAIKHGLRNKNGDGLLKIIFKKNGQLLECEIEDNGIGREQAQTVSGEKNNGKDHQSLGMQVTRERIEALKKEKNMNSDLKIIDLKNEEGNPAGTKVIVSFPYEEE